MFVNNFILNTSPVVFTAWSTEIKQLCAGEFTFFTSASRMGNYWE